jgi:hypothetical protein
MLCSGYSTSSLKIESNGSGRFAAEGKAPQKQGTFTKPAIAARIKVLLKNKKNTSGMTY